MGKIKDIYAKDRLQHIKIIQTYKLVCALAALLVGLLMVFMPGRLSSGGFIFLGLAVGIWLGTYSGE